MLISAAIAIGAAALGTLSTVTFLRWLGLHWTWTVPGVLLWPLLWPFDERAAVFAAGTALFAPSRCGRAGATEATLSG